MIALKYDLNTINSKREYIKKNLFIQSRFVKSEDFTSISDRDLYSLYNSYDDIFVETWHKNNFKGKIKLTLSRQLTRAAGNTKTKKNIAMIKPEDIEFEIKISLNHLINFDKTDRDKYVGGIKVNNKLDSLMLVFEHELCHVIEFLIYKKSNCSKQPFKSLISDLFGQSESHHKLVTTREANFSQYGLVPGDWVSFEYAGDELTGFINKINKRATVMSPSQHGKYVDKSGQHYTKYYIPLSCLTKKER